LRRLFSRLDAIFTLVVVVPTLLAVLYFGVVASDVYVSESHFLVRSEQHQTPTGLGALLQGTGFARSQDDTYSVVDFIASRDAMREVDAKVNLRRAFGAPGIDVLNRFPGLDGKDSLEALFKRYGGHVEVTYDSTSAISVLRVRAYSAEDAARINELLLEMGERLVNQLNDRSHHDLVDVAQREVDAAQERSKKAALAMSDFRMGKKIFDPERQGVAEIEGTAKLREQLLAAQAQLAQVLQVSPRNPQIPTLRQQVQLLQDAIAADTHRLVGQQSGLASQSPEYQRLQLDVAFADRQLAATLTALDSARSDAARKQLYLERLVQPNVADEATEPRRIRSVVTVLVLGLVLWGILSLVVASIREHAD
jgi:capsular polysaccharide transport system permease protein